MSRPRLLLVCCLVLVGAVWAQGDAPPATDAEHIARLIGQLGSPVFDQRKAATKELERIGQPALGALRTAAARHKDAEVRRRAGRLVEVLENRLDALIVEYRDLGLPLPPKEAKLVRYESGGGGIVNGKVQPKRYALAFLTKAATRTEPPHFLLGTHVWSPSWNPAIRVVAPEPAAVRGLGLGIDSGLGLAIQCHARGWDKLAHHLLEQSQKGATTSVRKQLIQLAWHYWLERVTHPKGDRAPVARRVHDLIRKDKELDTDHHRVLLKSLDLALVPSKAKPGSIEALIDGLVDYSADTGTIGVFERQDSYWRIAQLGFDAVPTLIDHLDDDRLTRSMMTGFNNFPSWHMRVKDVVGDLLEGLAGEESGRDWLRRQQGYEVEKAAARKWWKKARKVGEEAYLMAHALPPPQDKERVWPRDQILRVILTKYPRHIPSLYRTVLDKRPDVDSWELVEALQKCKLPDRDKMDLFVRAVRHKDSEHRLPAFHAILELDRKRFTALWLEAIEALPRDVPGKYWIAPEAHLAGLATECDDPRVWPLLEKVVRRSSLGLRMELLNQLGDRDTTRHRADCLRLLARFLDDAALRDERADKRLDGPGAGFPYPRIEVRDFVALKIARILDIKVELKLDRTPAEWAAIRGRVREALKRELGKAAPRPGTKNVRP